MEKIHSQIMDHLAQHTTQIPKGFLRYKTLELLGDAPMSGSEIAEEINRRTAGHWKPGPGSIYPLLAWLHKNGYALEQPVEKSGIKRYALTETGRQFLGQQKQLQLEPGNREKTMTFCLMDLLWFDGQDEMVRELHGSIVRLISALSGFNNATNGKPSQKTILDVKDAVDEAAGKIEAINKSLKESK